MSDPSTKNEWMFEAMALRRRVAELEAARDDALEQASDFSTQDEARAARIAELDAEIARLREDRAEFRIQAGEARLRAAACPATCSNSSAAYKQGARDAFELMRGSGHPVYTEALLARFLASRGTAIAESKREEG